MNFTFFLGGADAEMSAIRNLLTQQGQQVHDKGLRWGAKASAYAGEIAAAAAAGETPVLVELEVDIALPEGSVVVDHHGSRAHEPASILQVLGLLGQKPNRYEELIAANDAGYIPAMLAIGATPQEVAQIRSEDRAAQGITPEQEVEAERAIAAAEYVGGMIVVRPSHSKSATITDRLFGRQKRENILVLSGDGETNYFGNGALCAALKEMFGGWNGGSGLGEVDGNAFWGSGDAPQKEVFLFLADAATPALK